MFQLLIIVVLGLLALLLLSGGKKVNDLERYYAPKVHSGTEAGYWINIPVEIDVKDGKESFISMFEQYGFSGNGPSIEQVVRKNVQLEGAFYDSEGDNFFVYFDDHADFQNGLNELRCIEDIHCLSAWLGKASSILIKE